MALDRAPFDALVDSDGTPGSGSPWDKAAIEAVVLEPVEAEVTVTQSGTGAVSRAVKTKLGRLERSLMDYGADPALSAADNKTAIDHALAATPRGSTLYIDKGTFNVNGPLIRNQVSPTLDEASIHIRGFGKDSILRCMNNANLLQLTADEGANVVGFSLRDFLLTYNAGLTAGSALYLRHWHRGLIDNVYVAGAPEAALYLAQCIVNTFLNFVTTSGFDIGGAAPPRPNYGVVIDDYLGVASNGNTFLGGEVGAVNGSPGYGVYLAGTGRGNRFYNTVIESNDVGLVIDANHVDYAFDGVWLEANGTNYSIANGQGVFRPVGDLNMRWVCTYRAKGRRTTTQTIATGTGVDIEFDVNDYNVGYSGNIHALTNATTQARFVAPVAGTYEIKTTISWAANATGYRNLTLVKNGSSAVAGGVLQVPPVTGGETSMYVAADVVLAKDDYVTVQVLQTSGGPLNVAVGSVCSLRWVAEPFTT